MEQYREAFRMFDKDDDGKITAEEFKEIIVGIGLDYSDDQIQDMIFTAGHKNEIDFETFCNIKQNISPNNDTEENFIRCLNVLDNGNGKVNGYELKHIMMHMGDKHFDSDGIKKPNLDEEGVDQLLADAKMDKNGEFDLAAFARFCFPTK